MPEEQFKQLDKSLFNEQLDLVALRVPSRRCQEFRLNFGSYIICRTRLGSILLLKPRMSSIVADKDDKTKRLMLLKTTVRNTNLDGMPEDLAQWIQLQQDVEVIRYSVKLNYDYFTAGEVLERILPKGVEIPAAFEQVGHLIHLNLRDELLPYKYVIGQVLLDKIPTCKTVVNKVGKIDTVFRTFEMEVIAGEDNTLVSLKEENCVFKFDYREVYWNSRLQQEHTRLVQSFKKTDIIADMFCGIGPFVLPAAKKGCRVYGNDLNPRCFYYLNENLKLNKLEERVTTYNLDAREFIRQIAGEDVPITQIVMNLPVSAELFCDVFRTCFSVSQLGELSHRTTLTLFLEFIVTCSVVRIQWKIRFKCAIEEYLMYRDWKEFFRLR